MTNVRGFILEKCFRHAHPNLIIQKSWGQTTMALFFILFSVCHVNNTGTGHFVGINDQVLLATFSYAWTISCLQLIDLARLTCKLLLKYTNLLVCSKDHLKKRLMRSSHFTFLLTPILQSFKAAYGSQRSFKVSISSVSFLINTWQSPG